MRKFGVLSLVLVTLATGCGGSGGEADELPGRTVAESDVVAAETSTTLAPSTTAPTTTTVATTTTAPAPIRGAIPCVDGSADGFPCDGVDLEAIVGVGELGGDIGADFVSDLWGWVDPETNAEIVIVSLARGTAFVDVTDPSSPRVLGFLPIPDVEEVAGLNDMKVYADHVFIVGESPGHGLQIFDLKQLRPLIGELVTPAELVSTASFAGFSSAHNIAIVEETGAGFVVGSEQCLGGLYMLDLSTPTVPTNTGCFDADGYTHDAHCVLYGGPDQDYRKRQICFAANEDSLTVVDTTDPVAPQLVSRRGYEGASYAHQGWLSPDGTVFVMNDELDEYYRGTKTTTFVWDVTDLDAPVLAERFEHETNSIDHNLFVVGDVVFEANYLSGLRLLNLDTTAANGFLSLRGFFDTMPGEDEPTLDGAFGVYPFFPSGTVAVSDMEQGLFVLRPVEGDSLGPDPAGIG